MEIGQRLGIGNDSIKLIMDDISGSGLGWTFEMILSPRCTQYPYWFEHDVAVRFYSLDGALLFEVDNEPRRLERDEFIDIPAHTPYRLRGLERHPLKLYIAAPTDSPACSFREVGHALKQHAKTGHNGEVRYV